MIKLPRARIAIPFSTLVKALIKIPFIKLKRGDLNEQFERSLAAFWSLKYCATMPNCRVSLYYVLKSLRLQQGDEVLLTPLTIPDIVNAIRMLGLKPVFVDLSLDDQNIDIEDLERKISSKSKVLLLTYVSGIVPDMDLIMEKVRRHNLILLEDISQNYGSTYKDRLIGTFGVASIGSFSTGKTIASLLGGVILTNDKNIYDYIVDSASRELNKPNKIMLIRVLVEQIKIALATHPIIFSCVTYYAFRLFATLTPQSHFTFKKYSSKVVEKIPYYENYPILREAFPDEAMVWFSDLQAEIAMQSFRNLTRSIRLRRDRFAILCSNLNRDILELMPRALKNVNQNVYWHVPLYLKEDTLEFKKRFLKKGFDIIGFALRACSMEPVFEEYYQENPNTLLIKTNSVFLPIHESFTEKEMVKLAKSLNDHFEKRRSPVMKRYNLDNKTILITGAASGLGRCLTLNLADRAKKFILVDKNEEMLNEVVSILRGKGKDVDSYIFDFKYIDMLGQKIDEIYNNYEQIDVLFNVAGMEIAGFVDDLTLDSMREAHNVNCLAPFLFTSKIIPKMKKQGSGQIVSIASDMGKRGIPGRAPYCASKFSLVGFFESLRLELEPYNIDAVTVFPGVMNTNFWKNIRYEGRINAAGYDDKRPRNEPDAVAKRLIKKMEKRKRVISKFSPVTVYLFLNHTVPAFPDYITKKSLDFKKVNL